MLNLGQNFSDDLMNYARSKGHYDGSRITEDGATSLRLYAAERLLEDLT